MTTVPFRRKVSAAGVVAALRSDPHAPISAMIEIADRCNEVCVHCYQVQGQKGEIATSDWKKILDELAEMGVLFLTISGGEATLRKDFLEIVAYARHKRFAVKLFTNGLTMTAELAQQLADLAVQEVQISLYSHRPELHDWVTRVPGSWQKTVDGAKALIAAGVPVVLKSPLMSFNAPEYGELIELAASLGADYSLGSTVDPREDGDRSTERLRIDGERFLRVMQDPRFARPARRVREKRTLARSVCGACSGNVHVEANGEIRPCTQLAVPLGNALADGIRSTWEGNQEARMIRELTWADVHGCRDCDLQPYCSRCFATATHEAGDALAPYASACARARHEWQLSHGRAPTLAPAARDSSVGPYREIEPGVFAAAEDVRTEVDEERVARHEWLRPGASPAPIGGAVHAGGLVQIRRPGARREREEIVPGRRSPEAAE